MTPLREMSPLLASCPIFSNELPKYKGQVEGQGLSNLAGDIYMYPWDLYMYPWKMNIGFVTSDRLCEIREKTQKINIGLVATRNQHATKMSHYFLAGAETGHFCAYSNYSPHC